MAKSLNLDVGNMRHRLTVKLNPSLQETTYGSWVSVPTTQEIRWGSIEPISGRERLMAGQLVPEATHIIRMRHTSAVVPSATLTKGSRTFEVISAANVGERDRVLECLCKELV